MKHHVHTHAVIAGILEEVLHDQRLAEADPELLHCMQRVLDSKQEHAARHPKIPGGVNNACESAMSSAWVWCVKAVEGVAMLAPKDAESFRYSVNSALQRAWGDEYAPV